MTIAIMDGTTVPEIDLTGTVETFYRGSGKGGQHRNKTESAVRLQHPSGITVTCEAQRHKHQNQQLAWAELERRLRVQVSDQHASVTNAHRNSQISTRSFTWTQWRDEVTGNGKRASYSQLMKGKGFDKLAG